MKRQKTLPLSQGYRAARDLARELRLEAKRGRDVVAERREELSVKRAQERAERDRDRRLLGKLIKIYIADAETKLRPATMREVRRYLTLALAPLHDHDADRLEVRAVAAVLADIAKERGRTSANRARSYLSACLSFGVAIGMLERNVLIGTKRPQPEQRRDRVLDDSELRAVWLASRPGHGLRCRRPPVDAAGPAPRGGRRHAVVGDRPGTRAVAPAWLKDEEPPAARCSVANTGRGHPGGPQPR